MSLTGVAYQAKRRNDARANKLCGQCCKNYSGDAFRCDPCKHGEALKAVRWSPERKQLKGNDALWCDECIACGFHRYDCPTLRTRVA